MYYTIYNSNLVMVSTIDKVAWIYMDNAPFKVFKLFNSSKNSLVLYPTINNNYLLIEYKNKHNIYIGFYNPQKELYQTIIGKERDNEGTLIHNKRIQAYIDNVIVEKIKSFSNKYEFREMIDLDLFDIRKPLKEKYNLKNITIPSVEYVKINDWDIEFIRLSILPKVANINNQKGFRVNIKPKNLETLLELLENADRITNYNYVVIVDDYLVNYEICENKLPIIDRHINRNGFKITDKYFISNSYMIVDDIWVPITRFDENRVKLDYSVYNRKLNAFLSYINNL